MLSRAVRAAVLAMLVLPACASAHQGEHHIVQSRDHVTLDDGTIVRSTLHGDPVDAFEGHPTRGPLARAAADLTPWLASTWCGFERASDNAVNEIQPGYADFHVVYAYPSDMPNRFAQYATPIQQMMKDASDVIATAPGSSKSLRIDQGTNCGPQYIDISSVRLPHDRAYYAAKFTEWGGNGLDPAAQDLRANMPTARSKPRKLVIFLDHFEFTGYGGQGNLPSDASPGPTNPANYGDANQNAGIYGYGWSYMVADDRINGTHVTLHEIGHTLGAVDSPAPHSTGLGHCFDEWDLMCYADGGPKGHEESLTFSCPFTGSMEIWDCGANDYFSSSPGPSSYLSSHWNTYNSIFLCQVSACGKQLDRPLLAVHADDLSPWVGQPVTFTPDFTGTSAPLIGYRRFIDFADFYGAFDQAGPQQVYFYDTDSHLFRLMAVAQDGASAVGSVNLSARQATASVKLTSSAQSAQPGDQLKFTAEIGEDSGPVNQGMWSVDGVDQPGLAGSELTWIAGTPGYHYVAYHLYTKYGGSASASAGVTVSSPPLPPPPPPPPPPDPDQDGDGVFDLVDQCPSLKGPAPSGCPAQGGVLGGEQETRITGTLEADKPPRIISSRISAADPLVKLSGPRGSAAILSLKLPTQTARKLGLRSRRITLLRLTLHSVPTTYNLKLPAKLARLLKKGTVKASLELRPEPGRSTAVKSVKLVR